MHALGVVGGAGGLGGGVGGAVGAAGLQVIVVEFWTLCLPEDGKMGVRPSNQLHY